MSRSSNDQPPSPPDPPQTPRAQRHARRGPGLGMAAAITGIMLALFAGFLLGSGSPTPGPAIQHVGAPTTTRPPETARLVAEVTTCRQLSKVALEMAAQLDRSYANHAEAHRLYMQHKIPFGPVDKPGSVRWRWRKTLAERDEYSPAFRELAEGWRRECVT